jgi:hypothetical protein
VDSKPGKTRAGGHGSRVRGDKGSKVVRVGKTKGMLFVVKMAVFSAIVPFAVGRTDGKEVFLRQ